MIKQTMLYLLVLGATCSSAQAVPPNVVIIYADDLNPSGLGCYGGDVLTPNIDRLAEEGVRFTRYYATSAVCSPSRYSLLTGRYASRCKSLQDQFPTNDVALIRWNCRLEGKEKTIAHLLGDAGYETALVGKHHNIENMGLQERVPLDADPRDPDVVKVLEKNYETLVKAVRETTGFKQVINLYANNFHTLDMPAPLHHHNQDWVTDGAVKFIEANTDKPFFLHMALTIPHGPDPLLSMEADPSITPHGYLEEAPQVQPSRQDVFQRVEQAGLPRDAAPFTWIDDAVGAVIQALEEAGVGDHTIVFFASDHNELGKMTCYDLGCKTPAIIKWPDHISSGQVNDELVANIDITPTLLAACGVDVPVGYEVDGKNLFPMLGNGQPVRDELLLEITYTKSIVSKDWKYIATRFPKAVQATITPENRKMINQEGEMATFDPIAGTVAARYGVAERFPGYYDDDQLYQLTNDPDEQNNLAFNPEYTEQLETMRKDLGAVIKEFAHPFGRLGHAAE